MATISELKIALSQAGKALIGLTLPSSALSIGADVLLAGLGGLESILIIPDISHWQNDPTAYNTVPAIIMKSTQGTAGLTNIDSFRFRRAKFQQAGVMVAAYHYITNEDPVKQADFFLDQTHPAPDTGLAVDYEADGVSIASLLVFCNRVFQRTGVRPMIYTRANLIPANAPADLALYPLWLATEAPIPIIPKPWTKIVLQQYAQGRYPGYPDVIDLNRFAGTIDDLKAFWKTIAPQQITQQKLLDVPYINQEAPDARRYRNDCGPACVLMLMQYQDRKINVTSPSITVDQLSAETSLAQSDIGLTSVELVTLARKHGLTLRVGSGIDESFIVGQINAGNPVLCLISYAEILGRQNQGDRLGHFVVVTGYDDFNVYYHDPDFWDAGTFRAIMGKNFACPWSQFNRALAKAPAANQACIIGQYFQSTRMGVAWLAGMNIRADGNASATKIGDLAYKAQVDVDLSQQKTDSAGNFFVPILHGGWVALKNPAQGRVYLVAPTSWNPPFKASARGGHADAGGWSPDAIDLDVARRNEIETLMIVAYMSDQAATTIPLYRGAGVKNFILRATIGEKITTAERFINLTVPCLKSYAALLGNADLMIAISNEPNLVSEGWGSAWQDGKGFAQFWITVANAYRSIFPGCRLGFPAMSPGGDIAGVRLSEVTFVLQAQAALELSDWIGVHSYWQNQDGSDYVPSIDLWRRQFGTSKPIVGTEVGPTGPISVAAIMKAYKLLGDAGIPAMAWILNGRGDFKNADWRLSNIQLPHSVTIPPEPDIGGWGVQTLEGTYSDHLADYPAFMSVDGVGAVQAAHVRNPRSLKIIRFYDPAFDHPEEYVTTHGGIQAAVKFWIDRYWDRIKQVPYALIHGPCDGAPTPVAVAVERERIKQLAERGQTELGQPLRAIVGNYHVTATNDELWDRRDMQGLAAEVEQSGGAIGIHSYGQGVLSSNCGAGVWLPDGSWSDKVGGPLPERIDLSQAFLALRIARDAEVLAKLGLHPRMIASELGIDDCGGSISPDGTKSSNGIFLPHKIRTQGWRDCWDIWQSEGWSPNGPIAFYKAQLDWWARKTKLIGLVFAWNDHTNAKPGSDVGTFDVRNAL